MGVLISSWNTVCHPASSCLLQGSPSKTVLMRQFVITFSILETVQFHPVLMPENPFVRKVAALLWFRSHNWASTPRLQVNRLLSQRKMYNRLRKVGNFRLGTGAERAVGCARKPPRTSYQGLQKTFPSLPQERISQQLMATRNTVCEVINK